ncbi:hypothetical protein KJY73_21455 [Bowmanella sp. Y26]|uniref:hypothetical protein n=1 Tax=Bowmanella yangjiangensis TaxID=2811230 RepID=UPI001BDD4082|nr:hypothetical protein [Bowmanella yangjiangensis]MBT1066157.1 hypothetical protein [Bowmanella yangjiangensis]
MLRGQKIVIFVLAKTSETLKYVGDAIMLIWLAEMLAIFTPHPSYPCAGVMGYWGIVACYMLATLFYIIEQGVRRRYTQ